MTTSQDNILLAKQFGMIFTEYYSVVKYFAFMLLKSEEDAEEYQLRIADGLSWNLLYATFFAE